MPRSPHAAKVLRDQLITKLGRTADSKAGKSTMTPRGDPDGLGVYRTFEFDPVSSKILAKLLPSLTDPRVLMWGTPLDTGSGKAPKDVVTVTFVAGPSADDRTPFPLDAADDALDEQPSD